MADSTALQSSKEVAILLHETANQTPSTRNSRDPEVLTSPPPNPCATFQEKSAVAVLLILVIFQPYNLVQIFSLAGYIK